MSLTVSLGSGTLRVEVERANMPLEELCGFASRRSRKRGFVFVSKVLGKHYPVTPARMAEVHDLLAAKLGELPGPVVLIALAETATALGHGIADAWRRRTGSPMLFMHTTRYRLQHPLALQFDEAHSHATEHLLYRPADPEHDDLFRNARSLVLVDDEMSTGRTLTNLAKAYRQVNPHLASVHLTCITDWLGAARRREMAEQIGVPTTFVNLLEGSFQFEENAAFDPGPIPDVRGGGELKDGLLQRNHGRCGLLTPLTFDLDGMLPGIAARAGNRVLVLGTGEFTYPPFVLARRLQALGCDVRFQSTTRSPLLVAGDIAECLEFADNYHDAMPNFAYNLNTTDYDRIVIGYETTPLPTEHRLAASLNAVSVFF